MTRPSGSVFDSWQKQYGPTLRFTSIWRRPEILSFDPAVSNHIWNHPDLFSRVASARKQNYALTGRSVIWAEGADHKRMRKVLIASFSPSQIRAILPVFKEKAQELVRGLLTDVGQGNALDPKPRLARMTVDVIGLAGFDHDFESLSGREDEMLKAFENVLSSSNSRGLLAMLQFAGVPMAALAVRCELIPMICDICAEPFSSLQSKCANGPKRSGRCGHRPR